LDDQTRPRRCRTAAHSASSRVQSSEASPRVI
jgi:uncharacterized protein (UPF0147 family)